MRIKLNSGLLFAAARGAALAACMLAALYLENPAPERLKILLALMASLMVWVHLREAVLPGLRHRRRPENSTAGPEEQCLPAQARPDRFLTPLLFLVDVALLYAIELNSRYILNYYLHLLYFVLLVNAGVKLPRVQGLAVNTVTFAVSMSKFAELLAVNNNPSSLSAAMFSFFTGLLTIIIISYAKSMGEEKEVTDRLYGELKSYAGRIRELTVAGERNRIAREIHDSIGHSLTAVIMELEICSRVMEKDPRRAEEMIRQSIAGARSCLASVRRAVDALRPAELEGKQLETALGEMAGEFSRHCGIQVSIDLRHSPALLPPEAEIAVFRAAQEALTNSLRHGKASAVEIRSRRAGDGIVFSIADNGRGSPDIVPGHGLGGMRERLEPAGGRVSFWSAEKGGFTVEIFLPGGSHGKNQGSAG